MLLGRRGAIQKSGHDALYPVVVTLGRKPSPCRSRRRMVSENWLNITRTISARAPNAPGGSRQPPAPIGAWGRGACGRDRMPPGRTRRSAAPPASRTCAPGTRRQLRGEGHPFAERNQIRPDELSGTPQQNYRSKANRGRLEQPPVVWLGPRGWSITPQRSARP